MEALKQKLTSRKFWAALLAAGLAAYMALRGDALDESVLGSLRTAVEALVAYICGESVVDASRNILLKNAAAAASEEKR